MVTNKMSITAKFQFIVLLIQTEINTLLFRINRFQNARKMFCEALR
jgi:hypothetical protein